MKTNALKYIRDTYAVEAHQGHRIAYGCIDPICGTILGGKNGRLRVRFDGEKRTALLHPTWHVVYLPYTQDNDAARTHDALKAAALAEANQQP